ncbi:MAG: long-chain fatty acid--CoA ligase [Rubrobacteraceae bacterium]
MQESPTQRDVGGRAVEPDNLLLAVRRHVESKPSKAALVEKLDGRWRSISYAEFWDRVRGFAAGLSDLGVMVGSRVALMSSNRPEWPVSDLAIQSLGAVTVPVYPTLESGQVAHILSDSEARVLIVEDEKLLARIREVRDLIQDLHVVVMDGQTTGEENVVSFEDVEKAGHENPVQGWDDGWRALEREDAATVIYTSGTTGLPKGAVLTHENILSNLEGVIDALPMREDDIYLSFLPLSHVFERTGGQFLALSMGSTTYYAESIEKVPENLREVRPTVMLSVPRLYEKMYDRVMERVSSGSALRRKLFHAAIADGKRRYEIEKEGGEVGRGLQMRLKLWDRLVFGKLKEAVGGRARFFVAGGAKLSSEIGQFFYAGGIKIVEGYGLTETSPVISCNRLEKMRFGTVGPPIHNVEVQISEDGEILTRGPHVMRGYLNNEKATAEAFTEDGWFRTGDIGEFDDHGYLKVTDRAKNLIVLSTGKNVAPQPIETSIVAASHISQAILIGDGRKYVSALLVPDYDAVRNSLGRSESNERLSGDAEVRNLIEQELEEATRQFAGYERPKRFALLTEELSQERGELTPTLKIKLRVVRDHYADTIEKLYS